MLLLINVSHVVSQIVIIVQVLKFVTTVQMDIIFMKILVFAHKEKQLAMNQEIVYFVLSSIVITALLPIPVLPVQMVINFKVMNVFVLQEQPSVIRQTHVSVVQLINVKLVDIQTTVRYVTQLLL